jgi:hypothetical protein
MPATAHRPTAASFVSIRDDLKKNAAICKITETALDFSNILNRRKGKEQPDMLDGRTSRSINKNKVSLTGGRRSIKICEAARN